MEDSEVIAGLAHKLLPLFTMMGASQIVLLLTKLEGCRGKVWSDEVKQTTMTVLPLLRQVVEEAGKYLATL